MKFSFNTAARLVVVSAKLTGPTGHTDLQLVLDTGASRSLIRESILRAVGYDPAGSVRQTQMTTASGVQSAPVLVVQSLSSLGRDRWNLPVICHTLPSMSGRDGLLGLDFLRGHELRIDFHRGEIELN